MRGKRVKSRGGVYGFLLKMDDFNVFEEAL